MPLPIVLGILAVGAGIVGVGSGIHGAVKLKDAKDTMRLAESMQNDALEKLKKESNKTTSLMDSVGKLELNILNSFEQFSDLINKIQGRPEIKKINIDGVSIPKYKGEELKEVSAGAGLLLGGIGGAAVGTAGGFAAAGATTSAVMALGTASTGTAISTLSGAAATNATLAAIGGGALGTSATAGGVALGTTILGASTLGVGLLVGGIVFNITGSKLSAKADEAFDQAEETEENVEKICKYLNKLSKYARKFKKSLALVNDSYKEHLDYLEITINNENKTKWSQFSDEEKLVTENAILLVGLLYKMCQVKLVLADKTADGQNEINVKGIVDAELEADKFMEEKIYVA